MEGNDKARRKWCRLSFVSVLFGAIGAALSPVQSKYYDVMGFDGIVLLVWLPSFTALMLGLVSLMRPDRRGKWLALFGVILGLAGMGFSVHSWGIITSVPHSGQRSGVARRS